MLFNYNKLEQEKFVDKYDLKICKSVKYLGINLLKDTQKIKEHNYNILKGDFKKKLQEYTNLKLPWFGRIALLKMKILPKINFLKNVTSTDNRRLFKILARND